MKINTAEATTWSNEQLLTYLCDPKAKPYRGSNYFHGRDFSTGVLSSTSPRQLHETARHQGVYIKLEGGKPALREQVVEYLDGIPHAWVREALEHLREFDREAWRALDATIYRQTLGDTAEALAERIDCDRSAYFKRRARGVDAVSAYLSTALSKARRDRTS
ncbi:hypothetical protein D3C86_985300 [compost metagenome]